ncbi:hypothetical protein GCM10023340_03130 [Nocardioides marinquilinus]|uniref:Uncharacterized protein n=1 Tax=Nocardioides marinquilinus TaxID=1210400 RepID=A0ABP9P7Y1_9ACTN
MTEPSRRLGPFSGAQLTVLLVVALLAVSLPVGAVAAVKASRTAISSADGRKVVGVTGGRLQVQTQPPAVATARVAPLADALDPTVVGVLGSTCTTFVTAPARRAVVVTSINVDAYDVPSPPGPGRAVFLFRGDCSTQVQTVNPGSVGVTTLEYEPGLVVPAGGRLSALTLGGVAAELTVSGYLVAPGAVAPGSNRVAPAGRSRQADGVR